MPHSELESVLRRVRDLLVGSKAPFKNVSDLARAISYESGAYQRKADAAISGLHQALRGDRPYNGDLVRGTIVALTKRLRKVGVDESAGEAIIAEFQSLADQADLLYRTRASRVVERRRPMDELFAVDRSARYVIVWNGAPQGTLYGATHPLRQSMLQKLGLIPGEGPNATYVFIVPDVTRAERGWQSLFEQVTQPMPEISNASVLSPSEADGALSRLEEQGRLQVFYLNRPQVPASFVLYDYFDPQLCSCFVMGQTSSNEPWPMRLPLENALVYAQFCRSSLFKRSEREAWFTPCLWVTCVSG